MNFFKRPQKPKIQAKRHRMYVRFNDMMMTHLFFVMAIGFCWLNQAVGTAFMLSLIVIPELYVCYKTFHLKIDLKYNSIHNFAPSFAMILSSNEFWFNDYRFLIGAIMIPIVFYSWKRFFFFLKRLKKLTPVLNRVNKDIYKGSFINNNDFYHFKIFLTQNMSMLFCSEHTVELFRDNKPVLCDTLKAYMTDNSIQHVLDLKDDDFTLLTILEY